MPFTDRLNWDLESILPGGLEGEAFTASIAAVEARAEALVARADGLGEPGVDPAWAEVIVALEDASRDLGEPYAWLHCAAGADTADARIQRALGRASGIASRLERAWSRPEQAICRSDAAAVDAMAATPPLSEFKPLFDDLRRQTRLLLPPNEQRLAIDLAQSSLHEWTQLYDRVSGRLTVAVDGEQLSPGQAFNLLDSPDAGLRERAFRATNAAWTTAQDDCAAVLSNLTWTRKVLADRVGVSEVAQPLANHRLEEGTLAAMMEGCVASRPLMVRYFKAKARLLGKAKLDWYDLRAPLGGVDRKWSWADGQDFVVAQMERFPSEMADYARQALRDGHVEVEDRPGKRQGAFCIGFSRSHQSRVFMTWGGTTTNVLTLAHELGHAYHNHVMWDLPRSRRRVTSTLAESASTFAEALVRGAAMQQADDDATRLALLDEDLGTAGLMLCNIPVRYAFERALYAQRAQGPLDPERLSQTMVALQQEWYGDALGEPDPMFWAAKMHFYMSRPFYNYPYTFGYLFSGLIWARAMEEGPAWAGAYRELLRDTGAGPCEAVAQRHLGLDLSDPQAWTVAFTGLEERVARFEALAGG